MLSHRLITTTFSIALTAGAVLGAVHGNTM